MSAGGHVESKGGPSADDAGEGKGTDAPVADPDAWKELASKEFDVRLRSRISSAQRTRRLDLADPRHEHRNIFRYGLETIPRQVTKAFRSGALNELWLTNNMFTSVPDFVTMLPNLTTLCMTGNQLGALNAPLFKCVKLERLFLSHNRLVALPPEFAELKVLRELRLDHNHFSRFPVAITKARHLRRLGLSHNKITAVPTSIRRLPNLVEINLDNNRIGPTLPAELMRLGGLVSLGVANNCLESAPSLAKRPPGSMPLSILRISGNRSARFKVIHDTGVAIEGQNIPKRKDGYLQLRNGYLITEPDGSAHHRVDELEGYLKDGYRFNVTSANWYKQSDELKVLRARAKTRRMRKAAAEAEEKAASAAGGAGGAGAGATAAS